MVGRDLRARRNGGAAKLPRPSFIESNIITARSFFTIRSHAANTTLSFPPAAAMAATMPSVASGIPLTFRKPIVPRGDRSPSNVGVEMCGFGIILGERRGGMDKVGNAGMKVVRSRGEIVPRDFAAAVKDIKLAILQSRARAAHASMIRS